MDSSKNSLTAEGFDRFLSALDPDRDRAGARFEDLWAKLIKFFTLRGAEDPEHLADQTIDFAVRHIQKIEKPTDLQRWLYGVAQRMSLEYTRRKGEAISPESSTTSQEVEAETTNTCLEQCMAKLSPDKRELILRYYYEAEASKKIQSRKAMAEELGLSLSALRIRSQHIRATLEKCITECQNKQHEKR